MKNVIKIIVSDIKRLSTNVVAMVVIIGLTVIPCLYAWFNILSNWDPYGESATTNLQVAVASSDEGIMIGSVELNVGDIIISDWSNTHKCNNEEYFLAYKKRILELTGLIYYGYRI